MDDHYNFFTRKRKKHTQLVYNCIAFATKTRQNQRPIAAMNNQTKNKKKNIWLLHVLAFVFVCFFISFCYHFILPHPLTPLRNYGPGILILASFFSVSFLFWDFFPYSIFSSTGVATIGGGEGLNERTDGLKSEGLTLFRGRLDIFLALKHVIVPFLFVFFLLLSFFRFTLYSCDVYVPVRAGEKRRRRRSRQRWRSWREGVVAAGRGDGDGSHV